MTARQSPSAGLIDIGTTALYHEACGQGPALLLTSGDGDAGFWARVVPALVDEFTVVTYDRRGLSRSPRAEGWDATSVEEEADDAVALLRALGIASAVVVGHSGGASIVCALVARHPDVVRHAVAFEPPLLAVVPNGAEVVGDFRAVVDRAMAEGGPPRALEVFIRANAGDEGYESWLATADPALRERIFGNAAAFFSIELPAFAAFVPDRERLRASGVPLTVVVGEDNRDGWFGAAARWLVDGAGAELVELPGGHAGFETHRDTFVAMIRQIGRGVSAATEIPARA